MGTKCRSFCTVYGDITDLHALLAPQLARLRHVVGARRVAVLVLVVPRLAPRTLRQVLQQAIAR
jgi:hypothetical protein